jgi:hypothetical protein
MPLRFLSRFRGASNEQSGVLFDAGAPHGKVDGTDRFLHSYPGSSRNSIVQPSTKTYRLGSEGRPPGGETLPLKFNDTVFELLDDHGEENASVRSFTTQSSVFSRRSSVSSTSSAESHGGPSRSALTFLGKVRDKGVHSAIAEEVHARQTQKIEKFIDDEKDQGIGEAMHNAIGYRSNGQAKEMEPTAFARDFGENRRLNGDREAASAAVEQIQNHHHKGEQRGNLGSRDIAVNFERHGAGLDAASIALAYLEANHDYIHANEINRGAYQLPGVAKSPPAKSAEQPRGRAQYDDRTRDRGDASVSV